MAGETGNTAEIARAVSRDIFKHFKWHSHPQKDSNFSCVMDTHTGHSGKDSKTHPTDVVFSYEDPYLGRRIYLLTDLKSYGGPSITNTRIRSALRSLAQTVECASQSEEWSTRFGILSDEPSEVRGLLFVHNHDGQYRKSFHDELRKVNVRTLPISPSHILHFFSPDDIQRLYTIANDLLRLKAEKQISDDYTFYYPDLVMRRRLGDVWEQSATFESLAGPFVIIKHKGTSQNPPGYVVYYNRKGEKPEEFEYFLDCLSRYQLLDSDEKIQLRIVHPDADHDVKSRFDIAKSKYARAWAFDQSRQGVLDRIDLERLTAVAANYNPGDMGWR